MSQSTKTLGMRGEALAAKYLSSRGYKDLRTELPRPNRGAGYHSHEAGCHCLCGG